MGRAEALEAQVGELERELRALLDEYVEVQQRIQTLEELTGCDGDRAADRAVSDLPERLQRVAETTEGDESQSNETSEAATTFASQEEVAAAVERVEDTTEEASTADSDEDDLDDIIVG